jgi:hypothetical protein
MTLEKVIVVPMDGHANQWGASQPFDLKGNRKSHVSVSVSKKYKDGLFMIKSDLVQELVIKPQPL